MSTTPNQVAIAAGAYQGLSEGQSLAAMVYLLNQISGLNLTPEQIAKNSACYMCSDQGALLAQIVYLLNQIASK